VPSAQEVEEETIELMSDMTARCGCRGVVAVHIRDLNRTRFVSTYYLTTTTDYSGKKAIEPPFLDCAY
jgi:hypothetical protein